MISEAVSRRVIGPEHVALQALTITCGSLLGLWAPTHTPWARFQSWQSLTESLFHYGTPASYNLLRGDLSDTPSAEKVNFTCPSSSSFERNSRAIHQEEGPDSDLEAAFVKIAHALAGSDRGNMRFCGAGFRVQGCLMSSDSVLLAQATTIQRDEKGDFVVLGIKPSLTEAKCEEIQQMDNIDRNLYIKNLSFVDSLELFVAQAANTSFAIDVGYYLHASHVSYSSKEAVKRIESSISSLERCACCREQKQQCDSFCIECEDNQSLCTECKSNGFSSWSNLLRPCKQCQSSGNHCQRVTVLSFTTDMDSKNVGAINELLRRTENGLFHHMAQLMYDSYHHTRSARNVALSWFFYRNGQRICLIFLTALRCGPDKDIADAIIQSCSESALLAKDLHDMVSCNKALVVHSACAGLCNDDSAT